MPKANKPKASHLKTWRTEIDMKKNILFALFSIAVLGASATQAEEAGYINAVEYERLIINWNPNGTRLAQVLAYSCQTCAPVRLEVHQNTLLEESGETIHIEHLKSRVDWAGTVQTLSSQPDAITKIMLH